MCHVEHVRGILDLLRTRLAWVPFIDPRPRLMRHAQPGLYDLGPLPMTEDVRVIIKQAKVERLP